MGRARLGRPSEEPLFATASTLLASAETRLSEKRWAAPEINWVPLRRAVFTVHIREGDNCARVDGASLREWNEILASKSGAQRTEINPNDWSFSFQYVHEEECLIKWPPWEILGETPVASRSWSGFTVDATFTGSSPTVDDETSARLARRREAVHEATAFVWHQLMLPAFNCAVSIGAAVLYARPETKEAPFQRLRAGVWPLLKVVDWQNGMAVAPDGSMYRSIHVHRSATASLHVPATSKAPAVSVPRGVRGRKPRKREMIEQAMKRDILEGRTSLATLQEMLEKNLVEFYDASRDTVRKARNAVVSELVGNSISDK
jgi:hypothetical protein